MYHQDTNHDYAIALYETLLQVLKKDNKVEQAEKIIQELSNYAAEKAGKSEIEVVSARKLDNSIIKTIANHFGNKVEVKEIVDPTIIGGVIIKNKDKVFDGSVEGQLKNFRQTLE